MGVISAINDYKIKRINVSSYKQYSTDEIIKYINSFAKPKNNYERSYFQYKCNTKLYGVKPVICLLRNVICFFPFWILFFKTGKSKRQNHQDYVFISDEHKMDIIPEKYKGRYIQVSRSQGWLLKAQEKKMILKLWKKYGFSYYFLLKNLIKIANYRWAIETYNPKAILCSCEYSFTSSFLTEYCRSMKKEHINIMHGYNIIDLKCPFSTFDLMSIWDNFFINAYRTMRCGTTNFEVEKPKCVLLKKKLVVNEKPVITYYTQNYVKKAIPILQMLLQIAQDNSMILKIRCHPSYPLDKEDLALFPSNVFEDYRIVNIEQSLNTADFVVARNSTVLYQAVQLNKKILIDNIALPKEYIESRKKGSFLWKNNNTYLLSEFVKNPKLYLGDKLQLLK